MIELQHISKRYGKRWVLMNISATVARGECIALFGGNGAGKTTLLKMIATLLTPSKGKILLNTPRTSLRFLGHEKQLYSSLTVAEHVSFVETFRAAGKQTIGSDLIEMMGLASARDRKVVELSEGMKKRLALALLLIGESHLILLDEPHAGLDRDGKQLFYTMMQTWRREGKTILVASHDHDMILPLVDRIWRLDRGTFVTEGSR